MSTIRRFVAAVAATFVWAALLPAQNVQYRSVTSTDFGGPLGGVMKLAAKVGGASGDIVQTTYIKDRKMRTDLEKTSSIIDLDAGKIISINHGKKEYTELTFAEMQAALAKATPQAKSSTDVEARIDVKVDATSEKQVVNGAAAQRHFLTTTITLVPSEEQRKKGEQGAQLVLLNDLWLTRDAAYKETHAFNVAMADALGDQGQRTLAVLFAQYPNAQDGFKRAAGEMKKLDGAPVRTTVYFVALPEDMKFDRARLLAASEAKPTEPEKKKGGLGGMLKGIAKASAGAGGGEAEKSEAPADQVMLFRSTTDIMDIQTASVDAGLFVIPAGYKLVKPRD